MAAGNPQERLLDLWHRLSGLPTGKWIFSRIVGWMVPYTGTIKARVEKLEPGFASISLQERRRVRNHLRSVHAIALMNLGEFTTGMAALTSLPGHIRGILVAISMTYEKKARGRLVSECRFSPPESIDRDIDLEVPGVIRNEAGEVVARVSARWRFGPVR